MVLVSKFFYSRYLCNDHCGRIRGDLFLNYNVILILGTVIGNLMMKKF